MAAQIHTCVLVTLSAGVIGWTKCQVTFNKTFFLLFCGRVENTVFIHKTATQVASYRDRNNNKWHWSAPAGMGGGREGAKGNTWRRNADTTFFPSTPPSSCDRSAAARVDLTTYGMVGSMSGHMTRGCRREGKSRRRRRNVWGCNEYLHGPQMAVWGVMAL